MADYNWWWICTLYGLLSRCRCRNTIDDVQLGYQCSWAHVLSVLTVSPHIDAVVFPILLPTLTFNPIHHTTSLFLEGSLVDTSTCWRVPGGGVARFEAGVTPVIPENLELLG